MCVIHWETVTVKSDTSGCDLVIANKSADGHPGDIVRPSPPASCDTGGYPGVFGEYCGPFAASGLDLMSGTSAATARCAMVVSSVSPGRWEATGS